MAGQESLGRAILYLDVDDTALRQGVRNARQYVNQQLGRSGGGGQARGGGGKTPEDRRASTMVITRNLGERLNRLEERGRDVAQQRAALSRAAAATDKGRLETARSLNKLVREYVVQEERGLRASSRIGRQLADPIDARFQAQKRRYALDQQIRSLEAAGVRSDALRTRLGEVTTAQAQRRFGLARQLGDQLSFDLRKERDKLRVQQQQNAEQRRSMQEGRRIGGLNVSPILGGPQFPGSPKQRAASLNLKSSWSAFLQDLQDTAQVLQQAKQASSQYKGAKQFNARQSWIPFLEDLQDTAEAIRQTKKKSAKRAADSWKTFLNDLDTTASILERSRQQTRRQVTRVRESQRQENQGRLSSALIGGAFPLLFGQGPGAALGGFLGGGIGGAALGFGGSLVGTLLGQQFDIAIQKGTALATALVDPAKNLDTLTEQALLSSKGLEKYAGSLIETGRVAEARALLELDLAQRFSDTGSLTALITEQDKLQRNFSSLSVSIGNFISGPLIAFLSIVNRTLNRGGTVAGADGLPNLPSPADIAEQQRRSNLFTNAGFAISAAAPAGLAFGGPLGAGLATGALALGAGLVGLGQFLQPDSGADLEEFLKKIQEYKKARKDVNDLAAVEIELIKDGGDQLDASARNDLRLAAARLEYEIAIAAAKGDQAKIDAAERQRAKAEAAAEAAFKREQFQAGTSELNRQQKILAAFTDLQKAQVRLQNIPAFGATNTQQVLSTVTNSVFAAATEVTKASGQLVAAEKTLQFAQLFGGAEAVKDAANSVSTASIELQTAGINFAAAQKEAAVLLLNNVQAAATQFRDAIRSLRDLRLSNLRFLPAQQREQLIAAQKSIGLPEAERRGVALRSLEDLFSFNRFIEQETAGRQAVADAQRNLTEANNSLRSDVIQQTGALTQLTGVMTQLVDKSWSVYVQVPGQNVATAINLQAQLGS